MEKQQEATGIAVWGGIECTINRTNDQFHDQLELGKYYQYPAQLKAIIDIGFRTLRFPLLWEKHQPNQQATIDWSWAEEQLSILKANKIEPVIGLLHHGSGPAYTDLLQDNFPDLFASYAAKVAYKFPWITFYNPANEPLTTARFSGLYGLWYPHKKDDASFLRMLLNQLKGVVLAMQEIKKINPAAKLVQTEDLGKTYSTPLLHYQAAFENQRRWLSYDLLCGKVDAMHPLWKYCLRLGIEKEKLEFFCLHACPPDIIGVNYYLTSERYLDEKLHNYPAYAHGGNGFHAYADVEAVRVELQEPHGLPVLLGEVWQRYQIPVAITEVHLHCHREEQVRWLKYVYEIALQARQKGINILAITSWALLGSFGWDKLLTQFPGNYETGAFEIHNGNIRPTALAKMLFALVKNKSLLPELTQTPGWWKREDRYLVSPSTASVDSGLTFCRPILIIGRNGRLGKAFAKICKERHLHHVIVGRQEIDLKNSTQLVNAINHYHPWAIINTTGFGDIDKAEKEKADCHRENFEHIQQLAILCEREKIKLLAFSSDQVFGGDSDRPYTESDQTAPLNTYGRSKQLAELFIKKVNSSALIIRTSILFGPWDRINFLTEMLSAVITGSHFFAANDITVSPVYIPHLVHASLNLLIDDAQGTWHLANKCSITWYEWASMVAASAGLDNRLIIPEYDKKYLAKRPAYSALTSEKYFLMPTLEEANEQFLYDYKISTSFSSTKIITL